MNMELNGSKVFPIENGLSCMVCLSERWRKYIELKHRISSMFIVPSAATELDPATEFVWRA